MSCRTLLRLPVLLLTLVSLVWVPASAFAAPPAPRPVNLLFLITDQQRFDALGCAGNRVLKTPNLDRLARGGVQFAKAYTTCPVCAPARTTILTGKMMESTRIFDNQDIRNTDPPPLVSFDQLLLRSGYHGEYHGKYHSPYGLALEYTQPVRWVNGKRPPGSRADMSEGEAFQKYVAEHVPARPPRPGEHVANLYGRPYRPDPIDPSYAKGQDQVAQGTSYGCVDVPPEHTLTAWAVKDGLEGLERLKDGPFTLTISIGPPHPPFIAARPYYGMYPPDAMPVPASIDDPRTNSPYRRNRFDPAYRDPPKVRQMISDYYGLVTEVDDWVGRVLARLDELGLTDHTLVVFTSDHGEMLGDHGMAQKFVFYEGSVHVPLLMRLPGAIPAGRVIDSPVSHLDLFATILDYCGKPIPANEGASLRGLIAGQDSGDGRCVVSEWNSDALPGFMIYDGRWKLLFGRAADSASLDALYDLATDPHEEHNLLGNNPEWAKYRGEAERLKGLLVGWLAKVHSPSVERVKARPIAFQLEFPKPQPGARPKPKAKRAAAR